MSENYFFTALLSNRRVLRRLVELSLLLVFWYGVVSYGFAQQGAGEVGLADQAVAGVNESPSTELLGLTAQVGKPTYDNNAISQLEKKIHGALLPMLGKDNFYITLMPLTNVQQQLLSINAVLFINQLEVAMTSQQISELKTAVQSMIGLGQLRDSTVRVIQMRFANVSDNHSVDDLAQSGAFERFISTYGWLILASVFLLASLWFLFWRQRQAIKKLFEMNSLLASSSVRTNSSVVADKVIPPQQRVKAENSGVVNQVKAKPLKNRMDHTENDSVESTKMFIHDKQASSNKQRNKENNTELMEDKKFNDVVTVKPQAMDSKNVDHKEKSTDADMTVEDFLSNNVASKMKNNTHQVKHDIQTKVELPILSDKRSIADFTLKQYEMRLHQVMACVEKDPQRVVQVIRYWLDAHNAEFNR